MNHEVLKRLVRVATILEQDTREPLTKQRAQEILALVALIKLEEHHDTN